MLGSMLAGTDEAPGETGNLQGRKFKTPWYGIYCSNEESSGISYFKDLSAETVN